MEQFGIETKWRRFRRDEHELLLRTSANLAALQKRHTEDSELSGKQNEDVRKDVRKLTDMFPEENNMENGLIEESIQFVRDKYRKYLENG